MKRHSRLPRIDLPNATYFASATTAGRRAWFAASDPADKLCRLICAERGKTVLVHAFVVMPDHYHLLVTLLGDYRLPRIVQRINSLSARHINRSLSRSGRLWRRRFYDHVVRNAEDFDECFAYIHHNPCASGLAASAAEYRHSSAGYWERGSSPWGEVDPP